MIIVTILLLTARVSYSQDSIQYVDAATLMMVGKAKTTDSIYQRIDSTEAKDMPQAVKGLAKQSAGIAILFETNSRIIRAKWSLPKEVYLHNMTPDAHSGLDLYCFKAGKWQFVSIGRVVPGINQTQVVVQNMDSTMKQFMLYLPLYNGVSELQIGVQKNATINKPVRPAINTAKRIVVYGSSVVQGASASRAGMAYPAILQRQTGYDFINLGFSGSAKMEIELAKYLATVPADCYVLDCIPNPSPEQITERSYPFIKYLHEKQPSIPIVLVETIFRQNGLWDQQVGSTVKRQNEEIRKTYERLKKEGVKNLYYLESDKLIGDDHEATIDGIHLTDLGFTRIANAVWPVIKKALAEKKQ
ncbi:MULTISPECIES: SGNH/GDSL hydrolase family protein [Niastella]|uniref:SGNH/GDSL hydrolase family protein n=1 Tax=Niastella soli TaxID=2821487 RepID=A0ABS3YNE8_9BACT|nr:SGNH/GDSL hydrolase family protein [Niastella soli]MBO9199374.1 SGNH/GDSL hydrolase family protein [Niastella soli]